MAMGTLTITEVVNNGRSAKTAMYLPVEDFNDATEFLFKWLWTFQSQETACNIIMAWMRGEQYADHSVNVRHYVPGELGHWFEILYRA